VLAYVLLFSTALLIWKYYEPSLQQEEDENTLKLTLSFSSDAQPPAVASPTRRVPVAPIESDRLDFWLRNHSNTIGINLTAILARKRYGKYLVYVCHENCGGNHRCE
jgi:hypothetical protein